VDGDAGGDDYYPESDVGDEFEEEDLPLPELSPQYIHDKPVNPTSNGFTLADKEYFSDDEDANDFNRKTQIESSSPKSSPSEYLEISAFMIKEVKTLVNGKMNTQLEYEMDLWEIGPESVQTNKQRDEEIEAAINSEVQGITDDVDEVEALVASADPDATFDASYPTDEAPGAVTEAEIEDRPELDDDVVDDESTVFFGTQEGKVFIQNASVGKWPKKFLFRKLNPLANIQAYMANLKDLPYEEVYHRAEQIALVLKELQDEYEELDMEWEESEVYTKTKKKEATRAAKELAEANLKEEEPYLTEVYLKYEEQLNFQAKPWKAFLEGVEDSGLPTNDRDTYQRLKRLKDDSKLRDKISKRIQESTNPAPVAILEGVPLPKLTAEDLRNDQVRKKNRLMDPQEFEDKRQQDVYGLPYSTAVTKRGDQDLIDRNAIDENGEPVTENGRPKRTRGKRTLYETDQSEAPSAEEEEVLPAKRRRTQKIPGGTDIYGLDQGNTQSRAESPPPRTFASGKRIGRPKGSRTKPKPLKSKLNETHVPPESENDDNTAQPSPSSDEAVEKTQQASSGSGNRELAASEETQLYDSAKALVNQTLSAQGVVDAIPVKRKHAGGRPRKNAAVKAEFTSINNPELVSPAKPKGRGARNKKQPETENKLPAKKNPKGGRVGKKSAALDDIQLGEQDDLLPSTEQDDESRFASASTSRPTTSSSRVTESTLGSRRSTRALTRGASRFQGSGGFEDDGPAVSTRAKAGNKRKRDAAESSVEVAGDLDNLDTLNASPRKRRKNVTKSQTLQDFEEDVLSVEPQPKARQKRKRAGTAADSIEVLGPEHVEIDDAQDEEPPAKKKRTRLVGRKAKALKVETESDFGEDEADALPQQASKPATKKGKSNGDHQSETDVPNDYEGQPDIYNDSGDDTTGPVDPPSKKKRAPVKRPNGRKKAPSKKKGSESAGVGAELDEEALAVLEAKRKQKSEKLSASAKARWARGDMDEPMKKRARTNAAKNAAKKAAKLGLQGPNLAVAATTDNAATPLVFSAPNASVQQPAPEQASIQRDLVSDIPVPSQTPAPVPPPKLKGSRASVSKASASKGPAQNVATPVPVKRSTRERKPSRLALGMDGAGDEDDREVQSQFKSEYEHYQALTSPRSPIVLGKRNRKSMYDLSNLQDDDDEDFMM
jgi:hypothetical protein